MATHTITPYRAFSLRCMLMATLSLMATACTQPNAAYTTPSTPPPVVVMPAPAHMRVEPSSSSLPQNISIKWVGKKNALLVQALERFRSRLEKLSGQTIVFLSTPESNAPFSITLDCHTLEPTFPALSMQESYTLTSSQNGLSLSAQSQAGILHGLASALQLVERHENNAVLHHATLADSPRLQWRGLMLDVSRHFMSVPALLRQIDAMEMVKLNVLHLHLSDGQGFRVESHRFPRLQSIAAHGQYYTQQQIRFLVAYAAARGIRIVPEFDTPGHSFALLEAYPRYAAQAPLNMQDRAEKNRAALDPSNPETYKFIDALYAEMSNLFPDTYFHIGGDEVVAKQWANSAHIQAYMQAHHIKTLADLQAEFTRRITRSLIQHHKTVIGWDEIATADIPRATVVEAWRGFAHTASATAAGHPVVVSNGYYLDHLLPAAAYYAQDPLEPPPLPTQAEAAAQTSGPGGTLSGAAAATATSLSDAQKRLVIGAEGALWTEIVSEEMLDARLWPRTAALAERFWSEPEACDATTLYPRLAVMQDKLEELGLEGRANQSRMLSRLSPGQTAAAQTLLSLTAPVRNYAHNHEFLQIRHKQPATEQNLTTPADIAVPDSFVAETFNQQAAAFAHGQTTLKDTLHMRLTAWAYNHTLFAAAAAQNPALALTLPASYRLSALAQIGLNAIDHAQATHWRADAHALLTQTQNDIAASATSARVTNTPQPAGDLLQCIMPGIEALVRHAEQTH